MTHKEWEMKGEELFGPDKNKWAFVCPVCGHVATVKEWLDAGAPAGAVAFSCIGRWLPNPRISIGGKGPGPCNYAGGGLFGFNTLDVDGVKYFDFAPEKAA